jgi:hypothetical protein
LQKQYSETSGDEKIALLNVLGSLERENFASTFVSYGYSIDGAFNPFHAYNYEKQVRQCEASTLQEDLQQEIKEINWIY